MHTLAIDIGGTGIKALVLDDEGQLQGPQSYAKTPHPASPDAVVEVVDTLRRQANAYRRATIGFPGVVRRGVAYNAPNLGNELWAGVDLVQMFGALLDVPARAINDADLQGIGVVARRGVELVLTLGTGLGAALFSEGLLVPNLELGHHTFRGDLSYEDYVSDAELKRVGAAVWSRRVQEIFEPLRALFNYDTLYLGGGNLRNLKCELPEDTKTFSLEESLRGAVTLWSP